MMTEEQAKTKWCPLVRNFPDGHNADGLRRIELSACIGSKCMAWRNADQVGIGPNGEERKPVSASRSVRYADVGTKWIDRGYCGAFGPDAVKS